jgi:hypothetical protein
MSVVNRTHIWRLSIVLAIVTSTPYFVKEFQSDESIGLFLLFISFPLLSIYYIYRFKNNKSIQIGYYIRVMPKHGVFYPITAAILYLFFICVPFLFGWVLH